MLINFLSVDEYIDYRNLSSCKASNLSVSTLVNNIPLVYSIIKCSCHNTDKLTCGEMIRYQIKNLHVNYGTQTSFELILSQAVTKWLLSSHFHAY